MVALADRVSLPAAPAAPPAAVAQERAAAGPVAKVAGDATAGRALLAAKGCVACHVVPGVPGAIGTIGPTLAGIGNAARHATLANGAPNTPANLNAWIKDPQAQKPGTLMPNVGLTQKEADDLTAFLVTLR